MFLIPIFSIYSQQVSKITLISISKILKILKLMKLCKILMLVGMLFASTESTFDVFTTSHVEQTKIRNNNKKIKPQKHFCSENTIEKLRCNSKLNQACKRGQKTNQNPVCGFDSLGVKFDFNRQCQACQAKNIKYFFNGKCDSAPKICSESQQCVNGLCVQLLQQPQNADRQVCNTKADCSDLTDLCIANKCIDKRDLKKVLKVAEIKNPQLRQKSNKLRLEARKTQVQRRKREQDQYKNLGLQIEWKRQQIRTGGLINRNNGFNIRNQQTSSNKRSNIISN